MGHTAMNQADEALFITLWHQGASQQERAARLGVPLGTIEQGISPSQLVPALRWKERRRAYVTHSQKAIQVSAL
jgi:hypothetical protein